MRMASSVFGLPHRPTAESNASAIAKLGLVSIRTYGVRDGSQQDRRGEKRIALRKGRGSDSAGLLGLIRAGMLQLNISLTRLQMKINELPVDLKSKTRNMLWRIDYVRSKILCLD